VLVHRRIDAGGDIATDRRCGVSIRDEKARSRIPERRFCAQDQRRPLVDAICAEMHTILIAERLGRP